MGAGPPQLAVSPHPAPRRQGRAGRRWAGPVGPAAPVRGAEPAPQGGRAHTRRRIWHLVSQPGSRSPKFPPCTLPGVPLTASRRKEPRWGCANTSPDTPGPLRGPSPHPPPMPPRCAGTPPCPTTKAQALLPPGTGLGAFAGSNASGGGRAGQRHPQLCSFAVPPRGHHAPSPQGSRTPGGLPVTASPPRRDCGPCPCPVPLPGDGPPVTVLTATFPWPHCPP